MNKTATTGTGLRRTVLGVAIPLLCGAMATTARADDDGGNDSGNTFHLGGYVRGWASFNLDDMPETKGDDKWEPSMIRGSVMLDFDAHTGPVHWKLIGRADKEVKTHFLENLEKLRATNGTTGGDSENILDNYDGEELREAWAEFALNERVSFKVGRQQIVWGESDFFHAMDLVHGYDLSWRLFFEGENEEWRKPLWLVSTKINVPEANGQVQAFVRPALDSCRNIGNTYDIQGGRWFFQPYRGFDLTALTEHNCDHPDGDYKDWTGGIRWSGEAGPVNYSLAYLRTYSADPVANSVFAPHMEAPKGPLFDLINPQIDVFGATISGYSAAIDSVLSAEVAFTKDQPFNVGTGPLAINKFGNMGLGLGGVKKKDTLTVMLRADKNLNFQEMLGTNRPSFSSVQLFDTWVLNHKESDDLARLFAYGAPLKEHSTILTAFSVLNYKGDTINPSFAVGFDLTNGGGFAIPAVELVFGDAWRFKAEADIFWHNKQAKDLFDPTNAGVQLFGYFAHNSQLVFRLTRQF
jgi:hypothetical protein